MLLRTLDQCQFRLKEKKFIQQILTNKLGIRFNLLCPKILMLRQKFLKVIRSLCPSKKLVFFILIIQSLIILQIVIKILLMTTDHLYHKTTLVLSPSMRSLVWCGRLPVWIRAWSYKGYTDTISRNTTSFPVARFNKQKLTVYVLSSLCKASPLCPPLYEMPKEKKGSGLGFLKAKFLRQRLQYSLSGPLRIELTMLTSSGERGLAAVYLCMLFLLLV